MFCILINFIHYASYSRPPPPPPPQSSFKELYWQSNFKGITESNGYMVVVMTFYYFTTLEMSLSHVATECPSIDIIRHLLHRYERDILNLNVTGNVFC